ncbi:L-2-amino-thiazoline-4-carboxylic acid hydrolase [Salidesulfovibrio onnuriiensis]|uniref:L-2-amino-thiazoline-4-carboxylic acid hydrolase n=1 Tax=Salidesulfovibrio onnuriiensis TaxID=2583823 RepID=UPI00164FB24B|nr:L-2-amino-thiazoline-4-carboxylic acid hydrolase [Salidesulfovibrio onnuriiensis]
MKITQLERRKIEADMIGLLYRQMCEAMPQEAALAVVRAGLEKTAFRDGRAFAAQAPDGPSLEHFKSVVGLWAAGDAVEPEILEDGTDVFRLNILRCEYANAYRELGLPDELVRTISCCRDEPFARGYSERIEFRRTRTIAGGASHCDFLYRWKEG